MFLLLEKLFVKCEDRLGSAQVLEALKKLTHTPLLQQQLDKHEETLQPFVEISQQYKIIKRGSNIELKFDWERQ